LNETSRWSYIIKNSKQNDIALKIDTALHNEETVVPTIVKESAIKKPKEKTKELFVFKTAEPYRKDYSRLVYWCNPFEPINKGKLGTTQGWRKEERFKQYY
jgi:hypothetical protein